MLPSDLPEQCTSDGLQRQDAGLAQRPARDLPRQAQAAGELVDASRCRSSPAPRRGPSSGRGSSRRRRQLVHHRDAERSEQVGRPDAGDLQQPRRVDRAGTRRSPRAAPAPPRRCAVAVVDIAHADGALALEQDSAARASVRTSSPAVAFAGCRKARAAETPPARSDRALEIADAGLGRRCCSPCSAGCPMPTAPSMKASQIGWIQSMSVTGRSAVAAADAVVADRRCGARSACSRAAVGIAPAAIAALRPVVEIGRLAAVVDHAVDRASSRPACGPASVVIRRPPVHLRRLGLELPGDSPG